MTAVEAKAHAESQAYAKYRNRVREMVNIVTKENPDATREIERICHKYMRSMKSN